ncbi:MAG: penicillin acylase family protein [Rubricoccaceae bacterium]
MRLRYLSLLLAAVLPLAAPAQTAQTVTLTAPDGQQVRVERDAYGVPRIAAPTETALFFGQGFATAQDRLFQMETFWRSATGRLAELQGSAALNQDRAVRTVYYTPAERQAQFAALPAGIRAMVTAYVAGINAYIDSTAANPARYLPFEYTQFPLNQIGVTRWDTDKAVATMQFFMRNFGAIGGQELVRLAELEAQGEAWFNQNRPINDSAAPTTISNASRPTPPAAAPALPSVQSVRAGYPEGMAGFAARGAAAVQARQAEQEALFAQLGLPLGFGSFAGAVSGSISATGNALLLGAPQMGNPSQNAKTVTMEVELIGPSLHVAGMTVPGIPGVIIGRTADRAWTLTTGYTDNTDTYVVMRDASGLQYTYDGALRPFTVIPHTINVLGGAPVQHVALRTVHGPVIFADTQSPMAAAYRYAFWNRELDMVEAFYDIWRASSLAQFRAAAARVSMSFNVLYSDRAQNIAYWHVGVYPRRPGTVDPRLPALGDGSQEWIGTLAFAEHPQEINPAKGYFVNWNNKPAPWWNQGDNVNWRPGLRAYDGVTFLENHVRSTVPVTFDDLKEFFRITRSNPGGYNEYPGTYQQLIEFIEAEGYRAENLVPPGQSGFISTTGQRSAHFSDQWSFYTSSIGAGEIQLKPFLFTGQTATSAEEGAAGGFSLEAPAPNPSAHRASLRYRLERPAAVQLSVYDALGREVARLVDAPQAAGLHGATLRTEGLAPGVYLARLVVDGRARTQRIVVAR